MKRIGSKIYLHKSALSQIKSDDQRRAIEIAKGQIPKGFKYEIISIDSQTHEIAFTESPDWDDVFEPAVGNRWTFIMSENWKDVKDKKYGKAPISNPFIYHKRHLFVNPDYKGFDIEADKKRAKEVDALGLPTNKIGRRDYWKQHVLDKEKKINRFDEYLEAVKQG